MDSEFNVVKLNTNSDHDNPPENAIIHLWVLGRAPDHPEEYFGQFTSLDDAEKEVRSLLASGRYEEDEFFIFKCQAVVAIKNEKIPTKKVL